MASTPPFAVEPVTPAIGAEITGLDLSKTLDRATLDALYQALLEHYVLFFRDQNISPDQQLAFAETFGEIDRPHPVYPHAEGHPNVVLLQNGPDKKPDTNQWHTDLTFYENPPFASILYAKEVPQSGGDTLWASMVAAYDALPKDMQRQIDDLEAVHDMGDFRNNYLADGGIPAVNEALGRVGSALHPVAPRHPITGRRSLNVNQPFTRMIKGMNMRDSQRLLNYLLNHIACPEFQLRFRWRAGSVAMWDNRVTQHYAVSDYYPQRRTMHRVTVVSDRRAEAALRERKAG